MIKWKPVEYSRILGTWTCDMNHGMLMMSTIGQGFSYSLQISTTDGWGFLPLSSLEWKWFLEWTRAVVGLNEKFLHQQQQFQQFHHMLTLEKCNCWIFLGVSFFLYHVLLLLWPGISSVESSGPLQTKQGPVDYGQSQSRSQQSLNLWWCLNFFTSNHRCRHNEHL